MADLSYSILIDAHQAQNAAQRLEASLKRVDSATYSLTKSLGKAKDVMKRDLASAMTMVAEANTLLKTSFSEFGPKVTTAGNDISAMSKRIAAASKDAKTAYSTFKDTISGSDALFEKAEKAGDKYLATLKKLSSASNVTKKDLQKLDSLRKSWETSRGAAESSSPTLNTAHNQYQKSAATSHAALQKELRNTNELIKLMEADHAKATSRYKKTEKAIGDLSVVLFTLRQQYDSIKAADRDLSLGQKIAKAEKEYNNLSKTLDTAAKNVANLTGKLQMARQTRDDLNQRIAVSNNYMRLGSEAVSVHSARLKSLNDVTTQTTNSLDQLNARLASSKQNTLRTFAESKADRLAALRNSSFLSPFRDITSDSADTVSAFGMITKSARNALYAINAVRIAINLAFAASGIGAGVRVIADYDQTLADLSSTIKPLSGAGAEFNYQMEALKNTMEELGATSRFTTAEAGKGMIYMAQSGLEAAEVVSASKNVIDLAVASNTSLERASDIVVQSLRTFDIAASEAWKVTDTLAAGAKNSVTSIEQLANALHYVGPIAHTLGVQIDTTVAALGTLSDSGLQASMAGTGLRRVISEIINPTAKARKILDSYGLTIDKLNIQGLGLEKVLENIKNANLSVADSFAIWGDRGTPALQTIMTNFDKFEDKLKKVKLDAVFGTASAMRAEREDTLPGQMKALNSAVQEFIIKTSQYTGILKGLTSLLKSGATTIREWNAEIHNSLSTVFALGSMLASVLVTYKLMNGGTAALGKTISGFTKDIQTSSRAYLLFKQRQDEAKAGTSKFRQALVATQGQIAVFVTKSKALAGVAQIITSAVSLLKNLLSGIVIGAVIGGIVKYATSADQLSVAIEKTTKFADAFWEKQIDDAGRATKFLESYATSLTTLTQEAFAETKTRTAQNYQTIQSEIMKPQKRYLSGSIFATDASSTDIGSIVFGKTTSELLDMQIPDLQKLIEAEVRLEEDARKLQQNRWSTFSKDEQERIKEYTSALKAYLAEHQRLLLQMDEEKRRSSVASTADFAKAYLESRREAVAQIQTILQGFSGVMGSIDTKEIESTIDKLKKKRNELLTPSGSEESKGFWQAVVGTQDYETIAQYFDIDATRFTVKLKPKIKELYDAAEREIQNAQKQYEAQLRAEKKYSAEELEKKLAEHAIGLRKNLLSQLNVAPETLALLQTQLGTLGELFQGNQGLRIKSNLDEFLKNAESSNSLIAIGDQAQTAKNKLLELYSINQLAPFEIQFTDTMATVVAAEGAVTAETQAMQTQIETSLTAIYTALGKFSTAKFRTYAANQKVLSGLDKNTRKHVEGFSRQTGLSPELYDKSTGMWKGTPELPQEEINPLFKTYVAEHTNKTTNAMQKLKHEQDELRLKYRQYVAEVKSGSSAEIELAKLQLEKTKERNTVMEMASRAGLTAKDEEIAKTLKLVEATWKLKEAEAQRKFEEEKRTAPLQLSVTSVQATGLSAYPQQIALAKQQLTDLEAQLGGVTSGSQKWYEIMGQINQKGWEVYNLSSQQKQESLNIAIEYEKSRGNFSKMYELEVQLLGVEIQRLELAKLQTDLTEEQRENIQKQIDTLKLKQESANKNDPVAGAKDAILAMSESMSTYQLFNDVVTNSVSTLTNSLVSFFETGKFEASQFAAELGKMILDLTTKMLIVQSLKAMVFGFSNGGAVEVAALANGGMKNVTAYANGGVEQLNNVRKFATGGLLTSPTFFNTTSGTALAGEAGYEHIMPAARLSNGKWGVYAEGMGGNNNQFVINTNINVEGGSSGNAEDDNKLAATISEKVSQSIKDTVKAELVQQMRAGGLLNSNGNKRW